MRVDKFHTFSCRTLEVMVLIEAFTIVMVFLQVKVMVLVEAFTIVMLLLQVLNVVT